MTVWQLRVGLYLRWHDWGDRWSLYQGSANETHFLNDLGAGILHRIEQEPSDLDGLLRYLVEQTGLGLDAGLPDQIADLLRRFEELGLIERMAKPRDAALA